MQEYFLISPKEFFELQEMAKTEMQSTSNTEEDAEKQNYRPFATNMQTKTKQNFCERLKRKILMKIKIFNL